MKEKLIEYLNNQINECDSSYEELIQEYDSPEYADKMSAKSEAFKQVIDFINTL